MIHKKERDIGAFIAGIILGVLSVYFVFVAAAGAGHGGMFILCGLLSPLIVSLIAARRISLLGLVPNLVMSLCLTGYLVFFSPDLQQWSDIVYVVFVMLGVSVFLALLVSVPIDLLRRKFNKEEETPHVFSREE